MRNFNDVLDSMITAITTANKTDKDSDKVLAQLESINEDSRFTAPEARWEIRGGQVSEILDEFLDSHIIIPFWFVKIMAIFTTKGLVETVNYLKSQNKRVDC